MLLVHKKNKRKWEVAWMWLPHFLAADLALVKHVDQKMTEKFKGTDPKPADMHYEVIKLITKKYPIPGLRGYLESVESVSEEDPEEAEKV